jgi:hypothetical protein
VYGILAMLVVSVVFAPRNRLSVLTDGRLYCCAILQEDIVNATSIIVANLPVYFIIINLLLLDE